MEKKHILSEIGPGTPQQQTPGATQNKTPALDKIWSEFRNTYFGAQTNEANMINWLSAHIKSVGNFNWMNNKLKSEGYQNGFSGMINDEFGEGDYNNAMSIVNILKNIGIVAEVKPALIRGNKPTNNMLANSFRIVSYPKVTPAPATKTQVADPKITQQQKVQQRRKQITQQTQNTTKEIQKLLGQDQTGNLDSLNVERMIDLLKQ
jgi:hypothetical protein